MSFKVKEFFKQENNSARVIFSAIMLAAFLLVFSPAVAQFLRSTGSTGWGYGYGYGYGAGYGWDGGTVAGYRTDATNDDTFMLNEYGWGYGNMIVAPIDGVYNITVSDISSLFTVGLITVNGSDPASTTSVTFTDDVEITIASGITVTIPSGTILTATEAQNFATLTGSTSIDASSFVTGYTPVGTGVLFGLPSVGLTVTGGSITITTFIGTSYSREVLTVMHKSPGGTWASATTCTVSSTGYCTFTTTSLSSFAAAAGGGSGGNTGGGNTGGGTITPPVTPPVVVPVVIDPVTGFRTQTPAVLSSQEVARRVSLMAGTYNWQLINQSAYPATLAPNAETTVWIEVKNTGTAHWFDNGEHIVRLGSGSSYGNANQQRDYSSEFSNPTWYSANRPAIITHPEIEPGWHTRFQFTIKAPATAGVYKAYFTPVVDGIEWMKDIGLYWQITVQ